MEMFRKSAKTLQKVQVLHCCCLWQLCVSIAFFEWRYGSVYADIDSTLSSPFVDTEMKSSVLAAVTMYFPDSMALSFSPLLCCCK
jgi:hypothetical protein